MSAVVTVIFGVCKSVRLSLLFVFTFFKCSINPAAILNHVCSNIQSHDSVYVISVFSCFFSQFFGDTDSTQI
jgi:hypothetical protein